LGAARPRQEGPSDLRLVAPALGAWGAAALFLNRPAGWTVCAVVGCAVAAGLLLTCRTARWRLRGERPGSFRGERRGRHRPAVAALLLCVAASAASAG
ncbi:MBL fold metallo-hydrolase, partial [Streptomyces sp. TRM76130]|nr:MBL fold metallo-hydrolase [Streptomyces sp. TRM76130]